MKQFYKLALATVLLIFSISIQAQVKVEKSNEFIFVLGQKYYLHKVQKGQTLYSICKTYGVSESQIYAENSEVARDGLKTGSHIKIPSGSGNAIQNNVGTPKYISHKVERKQTMYFLTRKYNVSEAELISLNPELKDGLKTGQVIKVPKPGTVKMSSSGDYRFHTVQPGETMFSLAQRYGVEIAMLKVENPELKESGPRIGQVLRIPARSNSFEEILKVTHIENKTSNNYDPLYFEEQGVTPCNSFQYKKGHQFKIAVLLPLFIQENYSLRTSGKYFRNTARFYEFYNGLLLAAKKMKEAGLTVEFIVKDTKASTKRINEILALSDMQSVDLIIGPVYSENFKLVSAFSKKHKINLVAPFKLKHEHLVVTNPFVFLSTPSEGTQAGNISSYLASSYDRSIVVIHNGTLLEEKAIQTFKGKLVKSFASYENINEIVFKQVNYKIGGASAIQNALSVGLYNIVVIPSNDQVFITNVVSKLNYLTDKYKITVYGMNPWERFRNIEIEYLRNLKFHYGTTKYIDKESKAVKDFDFKYNAYFKNDPSSYAYMGYDISYFFLNALKDYGKHFQFCMPGGYSRNYTKGLRFDFNFERVSPFSGFENNWLRIVKIDNELNVVKVK